ncbi:redoxin family protein [Flavobacteriaceae bacterium R38]|nr:redoxin family protein [Flavobacteriaceae bacterium R38]
MKLTKNQISNLALLLFIGIFLFTPVGATIKIWANRIIAFSPSVVSEDKREVLTNYNWTIKDLTNNVDYNLNSAKGKVVLINFWATWCPPCIAEMPDLQKLYDEYGDKIVFLFVTNENAKTVNTFFNKNGYKLPVYQSRKKAPEILFSRSIPTTYLIDKEGKIVIEKTGAADWDSKKVKDQIDLLLSK